MKTRLRTATAALNGLVLIACVFYAATALGDDNLLALVGWAFAGFMSIERLATDYLAQTPKEKP